MARQIFLDTETTGLQPEQGDRIIEIAAVELLNRRPTGRTFHRYLNPDREISAGAAEVHGITSDMLADKPRFPEVVDEFLTFVAESELVIHNAPFDLAFLEHELRLAGREAGQLRACIAGVVDTLPLSRRLHPGKQHNLDALCRRYDVDNSRRERHGALLDAELLSEVWLAMTGGQATLAFEDGGGSVSATRLQSERTATGRVQRPDVSLPRVRVPGDELAAHVARLAAIAKKAGRCVWTEVVGEA